ncbi:hypothetical protein JRQ81_005536 [Phrynocephalus forsythii]|uniref:G-protein coupled receptors family 1 profile domain-containing protein n=1 Tax=Phrynocephalus forsythii TaxID=171643 RepID=A0A9Q1AVH4_9SAUR|nr:hypothetical protein JRQ81_005536 [Phrynocephalus forsythii]
MWLPVHRTTGKLTWCMEKWSNVAQGHKAKGSLGQRAAQNCQPCGQDGDAFTQVNRFGDLEIKNKTDNVEFMLVGFTDSPELQKILFGVFLIIYVSALAGNFILIVTICNSRSLHTPMYFLLVNLSLVNVFSISVTTPKLLQTLLTHRKTISFHGCIVQVYLIIWALGTELLLLSFMAFDRYAAICHPLRYTILMRKEVCVGIAAAVWVAGMVNSAVHAGFISQLSFCNSNIINHFFCDIPPILDLSCSDTYLNQSLTAVSDVIFGIGSCGLTMTSYLLILKAIFRIRSTEGKKKAFSTCSSHLIVHSTIIVLEMRNHSAITGFILVGLSSSPEHQMLLFWAFICIYAAALVSNILIVIAISTCSKLHTPMYFLLINLSVINVCSISITIPKMLQTILSQRKSITFAGCIAQVYLFTLTLGTELLLLAFMAFDRYAAICHPLQYTVIMRKEFCFGAMAGLWLTGMINSAVHTGLLVQLSFCRSNLINHFFCELPPMFKISCSDTTLNETMVFAASVIIAIGSCALTLTSYWLIVKTILGMRSTEGKRKAFSTCSSHVLVVSIYYSTIFYTFLRPASAYSLEEDKIIAILYSVVTPVLNPLIYSLRNADVKAALAKLIVKRLLQTD